MRTRRAVIVVGLVMIGAVGCRKMDSLPRETEREAEQRTGAVETTGAEAPRTRATTDRAPAPAPRAEPAEAPAPEAAEDDLAPPAADVPPSVARRMDAGRLSIVGSAVDRDRNLGLLPVYGADAGVQTPTPETP